MKILIVRLSAIGDVVHCLPLAAQIKARFPQANITWLVEPPARALLENNEAVDQVIVFEKKDLTRGWNNPLNLGTKISKFKTLLTTLSANQFDLAIDAQGLLKSSLLAKWSGAPVRVGFKGAREGSSGFMTDTLDVGDYYRPDRHVVDHNIDLANFALEALARRKNLVLEAAPAAVSFPLPRLEPAVAQGIEALLVAGTSAPEPAQAPPVISTDSAPQAILSQQAPPAIPELESPSQAPHVVLAETIGGAAPPPGLVENMANKVAVLIPGTTWATKIWPTQKWIELGAALVNSGAARLIICGGKADLEMNQSIYIGIEAQVKNKAAIVDLTAKTDLMQLVALFKMTDIVVGADTGPMHLAVAVDRPQVVAIHGSTPWLRNGPYGAKGHAVYAAIACQPCFSKTCLLPGKTIECLRDLPSAKVLEVIGKL